MEAVAPRYTGLGFKRPSALFFAALLGIEGFASVSLQPLFYRQVNPEVGNDVMIMGTNISMYLLALMLGYYVGGKKRKPLTSLRNNLYTASLLMLFTGSYVLSNVFFETYYSLFIDVPILNSPLSALVMFYSVSLLPIAFFLGQTLPLLVRFIRGDRVSSQNGNALSISTLGNVIGAFMTPVILLYYLGVGWTVFVNSMALAMLVLLLTPNGKLIKHITYVLLIGVLGFSLNVALENRYFVHTNAYANYAVNLDEKGGKQFFVNDSLASGISVDRKGKPYIEEFKKILFADLKMTDKDILVIGAGGFTLSAENEYGNRFTYVDVDPAIKEIAEQHFLDEPIKGEFFGGDGRVFVAKNDKLWDAIVVDVFSNLSMIPWHLATVHFYQELKSKLKPGGVVLFNILANPTFSDPYSQGIDNTIRSSFNTCSNSPASYSDNLVNIIYTCRNIEGRYDRVYSDLKSDLSFHSFVAKGRRYEVQL